MRTIDFWTIPSSSHLNTNFHLKPKNQKFNIEENVMSEPVKMPNRHFLRRDYLHIFFYIKFLVFVSLVLKKSIYFVKIVRILLERATKAVISSGFNGWFARRARS